jgi:diacylglycerol kinase family enzyme
MFMGRFFLQTFPPFVDHLNIDELFVLPFSLDGSAYSRVQYSNTPHFAVFDGGSVTESMPEAEPLLIKKVVVVHSPRSGRSRQFTWALTSLRAAGIAVVDVLPIASLADLPPQGARWQDEGIDCVVAAGGDGLLGSVAAHVISAALPVGILPLGTGNDVARTVGIPMHIEQAVAVIRRGRRQEVDIGIARSILQEVLPAFSTSSLQIEPTQPASKSMYFVHALTVGLNVQFARTATRAPVRQHYGALTYPYAIYRALRTYKRVEVSLEFEDLALRTDASAPPTITEKSAVLHCRAAQISVVNAAVFWGPLQARVPGASLYDRVLDIVVIEDGFLQDLHYRLARLFTGKQRPAPEDYLWHTRYPELLSAQRTAIPGVHHIQARGVKIIASGQRRGVTLDGEVRGSTPVHAQVAPRQLVLLVPPSAG